MNWRIEIAQATGPYTLASEHTRFGDTWKAWDALEVTGGARKRLLRNGRVIRRERSIPTPAPQTPPVAQEALWTA